MKKLRLILVSLLSALFVTLGASDGSMAKGLDFGWASPIQLSQKSTQNEPRTYLAWPIQVRNITNKRLVPLLEIVAVTNTGRQYIPISEVRISNLPLFDQVVNLSDLGSSIFPTVTRRAIAVFQNVDPKASTIDFYVGGLVGPNSSPGGKGAYLRITYRRVLSGWIWEEINTIN